MIKPLLYVLVSSALLVSCGEEEASKQQEVQEAPQEETKFISQEERAKIWEAKYPPFKYRSSEYNKIKLAFEDDQRVY